MARGEWRLGRRPGLDGLRGIAIMLVLVDHSVGLVSQRSFAPLGMAGVSVFFALSGFLITALLLDEHAESGGISLPSFYLRRARRLLPALSLLLAALLAIRPFVSALDLAPSVWPTVLYVANWQQISGHDLGALNPTWSLAVEEQFYLVWPVALLLVIRRRRGPLLLAALVIAASSVLRFTLGTGLRVHDGSDTQAASLMVGALLAILLHQGLPAWRVSPKLIAVASACLFGWALAQSSWSAAVLVPTVVPVVTALLIWATCSSPGGPLEWGWLRYTGRRSYALYLWHTPLAWIAELVIGVSVGAVAISVLATFAIAELSWRVIEQPFLGGSGRRAATTSAPAPAWLGLAEAPGVSSSGRSQ